MSRWFPALLLALSCAGTAPAAGLLLPAEGGTPLAMLNHHVSVAIDEQVAVTKVEQTFRNHTGRALEATYYFPVPKGASVNKFSMWVDGKEVKGELVEAEQARQVYNDVVAKMKDPGILEYAGTNLLKLRVFPVPANGDQKIAVSFTSINEQDSGLVSYAYPLRTDGKASTTEQDFCLDVTIKSKEAVQNVYSPTHPVAVTHKNDKSAHVRFEKKQADLGRDFQLYYSLGKGDVGLTGLTHRPVSSEPGHVLFLISPRAELSKTQELPRDFVFVMDTSGSMAGAKMEQARKALLYCINQLKPKDRFAVMNFATVVGQFSDGLSRVDRDTTDQAKKWVRELQSTGGTAIDAALQAALSLRSGDASRPFTVVFFTDGEPTIGETRPEQILKNVTARNSSQTRIFTFGVGDDVNATLLDRLADATRAVSTYVRPEEDIEAKVSGLYAKISHPVMTDLKLTVGMTLETAGQNTRIDTSFPMTTNSVKLTEVYPTKLPDLFHGGQVVVLARYTGHGATTVELTGKVGSEERKFVYELKFPDKTGEERAFVEQLWARRKVGYLLDEIRRNGEKAELKDEVVKLAKKHGITTPYTSYLVVPDVATPTLPRVVTGTPQRAPGATDEPYLPRGFNVVGVTPPASAPGNVGTPLQTFQSGTVTSPSAAPYGASGSGTGGMPQPRYLEHPPTYYPPVAPTDGVVNSTTLNAAERDEGPSATDPAAEKNLLRQALQNGQANTGKLGVDLALTLDDMRNNSRVGETKARRVAGRTCNEVNGVWVDDAYDAKMTTVRVKAMSAAYFELLKKQASLGEVFKLGTRIVWVTPSGTALVIDPTAGEESISDEQIAELFSAKK